MTPNAVEVGNLSGFLIGEKEFCFDNSNGAAYWHSVMENPLPETCEVF